VTEISPSRPPPSAAAIGKSRTSTVAALHSLRDAGLATNEDRIWALVEPEAPHECRGGEHLARAAA
jgi:hypothetical protein